MLRLSLEADSGPSYPLRLSFTSNGPWGRAANYSEDGVPGRLQSHGTSPEPESSRTP